MGDQWSTAIIIYHVPLRWSKLDSGRSACLVPGIDVSSFFVCQLVPLENVWFGAQTKPCLLHLKTYSTPISPISIDVFPRETKTSKHEKWNFMRSSYQAPWMDINNKLSVASDHLSNVSIQHWLVRQRHGNMFTQQRQYCSIASHG